MVTCNNTNSRLLKYKHTAHFYQNNSLFWFFNVTVIGYNNLWIIILEELDSCFICLCVSNEASDGGHTFFPVPIFLRSIWRSTGQASIFIEKKKPESNKNEQNTCIRYYSTWLINNISPIVSVIFLPWTGNQLQNYFSVILVSIKVPCDFISSCSGQRRIIVSFTLRLWWVLRKCSWKINFPGWSLCWS